MKDCAFLVIEKETGLVDGWYMQGNNALDACKQWDKRRSNYTHELLVLPKEDMYYLEDKVLMNRNTDLNEVTH